MSSNIEVKLDVLNQMASPALYAASLANRPAASFTGRLFVDSDSPSTGIYRDTGTTWVQVADQGAGTTGTLQQVTNNGNTTTLGITVAAQTFIGTAAPTSSGLFVVNTATSDNHIVVLGANAPSIRIRGAATSLTLSIGLGLSTAANNFIQGSVSGDYCIFNSNSTASPILFGIYNGTNTQEAIRISGARNFLVNYTGTDTGELLQIYGTAKISSSLTANSLIKSGGTAAQILAADGSIITAGTGISISSGNISSSGTSAVLPTFTITTNNNFPAIYQFDNYQLNENLSGYSITGYTKTGVFTPSNSSTYLTLSSDVQILTSFSNSFSALTSLSFPNLIMISGNFTGALPLITDIAGSVPSLQYISGSLGLNNTTVTNLNFNNLIYVGSIVFNLNNSAVVTSISFTNLIYCAGQFNITNQAAVTTFNFPALQYIGDRIAITGLTNLTTINFTSLKVLQVSNSVPSILSQNNTALTTFTLPSITDIYGITGNNAIQFTTGNANLTTFTFGTGLLRVGSFGSNGVLFTSCALNQASVDNILVRLAALDGTGGTTAFSSRIVTVTGTSSTPSATGLAAKTVLVARGCTVTNN